MLIPGLSGLRGLAILIIVFYHLFQIRSIEGLALWDWKLYQFVMLLPVVVSIFFILGGFLRSLSYWRAIEDGGPPPDFWSGLRDRFWRIAPLFYVALILSFFWSVFLGAYDSMSFLAGFTFFSWVLPETFFPVIQNGPLWFVAYDMMGNILVMLFMMALIRGKRSRLLTSLQITGIASYLLMFGLAFFFLLVLHFAFISIPFQSGAGIVAVWFPYYNPFIFGIYSLFGASLAGLYLYGKKHIAPHYVSDILALGSTLLIGIYLASILGAGDLDHSYPRSPYRFPLVPVLFGCLIFSLLFSRSLARFLDNRLFLFLARISYSLYLFHALVIGIFLKFVFGAEPLHWAPWSIFVIVTLLSSILIAYALTLLEEKQRNKKRPVK